MRSIVGLDGRIGIAVKDVTSERGRMSVWGRRDLLPTGMTVSRSNVSLLFRVLFTVSGGSCDVPDYSWGDWAVGQVERVWDLMDILYLRSAKRGIDPSYKT